jgi:hypothetical protein
VTWLAVNATPVEPAEHPPRKVASRVRFSGKDRLVIDGPFAETNGLIVGY